jgi:hypothetical protein
MLFLEVVYDLLSGILGIVLVIQNLIFVFLFRLFQKFVVLTLNDLCLFFDSLFYFVAEQGIKSLVHLNTVSIVIFKYLIVCQLVGTSSLDPFSKFGNLTHSIEIIFLTLFDELILLHTTQCWFSLFGWWFMLSD